MIMVPAELAAVIAGCDPDRPLRGAEADDGGDAGAHRIGDRFRAQPVDDDLQHARDVGGETPNRLSPSGSCSRPRWWKRAAPCISSRSRARADDAAGERHDGVARRGDPLHGGLRFRQLEPFRLAPMMRRVAAADRRFGQARGRLADELAVHDRDAPIMAAADLLRDLPAIPEVAKRGTELERLLAIDAAISRRCRRR